MLYYEVIANGDTTKEYSDIPGSNKWVTIINETSYTVHIYNKQDEDIINEIIAVKPNRALTLLLPPSRISRYLKIKLTGGTEKEKVIIMLNTFNLGL